MKAENELADMALQIYEIVKDLKIEEAVGLLECSKHGIILANIDGYKKRN